MATGRHHIDNSLGNTALQRRCFAVRARGGGKSPADMPLMSHRPAAMNMLEATHASTLSSPFFASTLSVPPSFNWPPISKRAATVSTRCWIKRFNGRAP